VLPGPGGPAGRGSGKALQPPSRDVIARAVLILALYFLFRWSLGAIRLPLQTPFWVLVVLQAVTAVGAIGLPIAGIAALVRANRSAAGALGVAILGLALWLGLAFGLRKSPAAVMAASAALQDLGKILAAAGVGIALATGLREPNILLPAGAFAAFADFVVVHFGTVKHALSTPKGQKLVEAVSAQVPSVHPSLGAPLTIGPADFLFLGIFLACAARFGMGLRRNAGILTAVLSASLLLVLAVGALPALAPMSIAFVAANWRKFSLTREELISTTLVLLLMGGLFLGYFLFLFPKG
jgi:hypothetical protein